MHFGTTSIRPNYHVISTNRSQNGTNMDSFWLLCLRHQQWGWTYILHKSPKWLIRSVITFRSEFSKHSLSMWTHVSILRYPLVLMIYMILPCNTANQYKDCWGTSCLLWCQILLHFSSNDLTCLQLNAIHCNPWKLNFDLVGPLCARLC